VCSAFHGTTAPPRFPESASDKTPSRTPVERYSCQWRLHDAERTAKELPHREKYLLLVIGFLRRLLDL
jgi:hypothetical protein